jgi:hypothetical protein
VQGEPERRDPDQRLACGRELAHVRVPQHRKGKLTTGRQVWPATRLRFAKASFRRKPWSRGRVPPSPR